jgi:predicted MFS family arabinose efflux permease
MNSFKEKSLSQSIVILMAVAAGASVASIYYNQPILKEIARTFNVSESNAGLTSMLSQIGYGLGLFFITPLGDKVNKKALILTLQSSLVAALLLMTVATSITQVWIISTVIGVLSVSVQVLLPMAASLDNVNRGKTVGTVVSGILIGILAARVLSGLVAEWLGWKYIYGISAMLILMLTVLMKYYLPSVQNEFKGSYFQLLKSAVLQIKRFKLLRKTTTIGSLMFGVFCSFWTTFTFHISGAPFNFHPDTIGLFGLIAIAGAFVAPVVGKLADKGNSGQAQMLASGLVIFSIVLLKIFPGSLLVLIIAVLLLDIGIQSNNVTNQALNYTLDEASHSRINTIYMTTFFVSGAIGTLVGLLCWKYGGWNWVTWQMLIWAIIACAVIFKKSD